MARKKQIIKALETGPQDKRTKTTTQKAVKGLSNFKPSVIAEKLGITTQKWNSIKKKIQGGKLYNSKLRDILTGVKEKITGRKKESPEQKAFREDAGLSKKEFDKQAKKLQKEIKAEKKRAQDIDSEGNITNKKGWAETKKGAVYYDDLKTAKKYYSHLKEVKKLPSLKQADEWLKRIGAGKEYFTIIRETTKKGQNIFKVYDIRSPKEKARRQNSKTSKHDGVARAQQIKKGKK